MYLCIEALAVVLLECSCVSHLSVSQAMSLSLLTARHGSHALGMVVIAS